MQNYLSPQWFIAGTEHNRCHIMTFYCQLSTIPENLETTSTASVSSPQSQLIDKNVTPAQPLAQGALWMCVKKKDKQALVLCFAGRIRLWCDNVRYRIDWIPKIIKSNPKSTSSSLYATQMNVWAPQRQHPPPIRQPKLVSYRLDDGWPQNRISSVH